MSCEEAPLLPQTLVSIGAPAEPAAADMEMTPTAASASQPQRHSLPGGKPPAAEQATDSASAQPNGRPPMAASRPVVKVEPDRPVSCGLQPEQGTEERCAADTQPTSGDTVHKRQASSIDVPEGQQPPAWKRQCTRSPSVASNNGQGADEAAAVPGSGRRLLPGCQRLIESTPAAGPEAVARINAHCIDAPADHVLLAR